MGVIAIRFQPVFINNAWSGKEKGNWVKCWLHLFREKAEEEIKWSAKEEKAQTNQHFDGKPFHTCDNLDASA